jgi:hypothetical protein
VAAAESELESPLEISMPEVLLLALWMLAVVQPTAMPGRSGSVTALQSVVLARSLLRQWVRSLYRSLLLYLVELKMPALARREAAELAGQSQF